MTSDLAHIIADYRERCAQHLQSATPDSDEHLTYSRILKVFDQNQAGEPGDRSRSLVQALAFEANSRGALPMAPREIHEQAARVRRIVTQWAEDFKRDTGHSWIKLNFVQR